MAVSYTHLPDQGPHYQPLEADGEELKWQARGQAALHHLALIEGLVVWALIGEMCIRDRPKDLTQRYAAPFAATSARMNSGVEPQQPPTNDAPASRSAAKYEAKYSAVVA